MADPVPDPPRDACANCAAPLAAAYCGACGQRRVTGRLRTREIVGELAAKLVDVEHGFLHTARRIVLRPDTVTLDWLHGRRRDLTPPLRLFLVVMALAIAFQMWLTRVFPLGAQGAAGMEQMRALLERVGLGGDDWQAALRQMTWAFAALGVPTLALGTWVTFRPWRRTFAEHLAGAAYVHCGVFLATLPLLLVENLAGTRTDTGVYWLTWTVQQAGFAAGLTRTFPGGPVGRRVARSVAALVVSTTALAIVACSAIGVLVILLVALR